MNTGTSEDSESRAEDSESRAESRARSPWAIGKCIQHVRWVGSGGVPSPKSQRSAVVSKFDNTEFDKIRLLSQRKSEEGHHLRFPIFLRRFALRDLAWALCSRR